MITRLTRQEMQINNLLKAGKFTEKGKAAGMALRNGTEFNFGPRHYYV